MFHTCPRTDSPNMRPFTCFCSLLCATLAAPAALAQAPSTSSGQAYPVKPIRVVLGFPAGTNVDVLVRPVAQKMSEILGQQVIVDNRPGATGIIANEFVAKAAPDGYTLLGAPGSSITASPHMHRKMPYDSLKDLAPVAQISAFPNLLVVNPVVPAKTVKELIALARARPGQLTFGSSGNGSAFHLAGELFKSMAKVDLLHVPYKGGNQALLDVIGGRIDLLFYSLAITQPHIKAGKVRAIAVTGLKRDALMPELPTLDEAGLRGYDITGWHGFFAPAGTPREVIDRLNTAVAKVFGAREIRDLWASQGMEAVAATPEQFAARVRSDYEKYARLIRQAGIQPE